MQEVRGFNFPVVTGVSDSSRKLFTAKYLMSAPLLINFRVFSDHLHLLHFSGLTIFFHSILIRTSALQCEYQVHIEPSVSISKVPHRVNSKKELSNSRIVFAIYPYRSLLGETVKQRFQKQKARFSFQFLRAIFQANCLKSENFLILNFRFP